MRVILSIFYVEYTFKICLLLHIKNPYFIHFFAYFQNQRKCILNVNLPNKIETDDVRLPQDYLRHFMKVLLLSYITNPILVQRIVDFLELQKITSKSINVLVFEQSNSISKNSVLENQKYHEKILINTYAVPLI